MYCEQNGEIFGFYTVLFKSLYFFNS